MNMKLSNPKMNADSGKLCEILSPCFMLINDKIMVLMISNGPFQKEGKSDVGSFFKINHRP